MFTLPRCMTAYLPVASSVDTRSVPRPAMCLSPLENIEGPRIQVGEGCQGHSTAWIPAVANGVVRCY